MGVFADSRCLMCQLERNLQTARKLGSEAQATAFAKDLMRLLCDAPEGVSAPFFTPGVAELFHRHYGLSLDRYAEEKKQSNAFILARMDDIREKIYETQGIDVGYDIELDYFWCFNEFEEKYSVDDVNGLTKSNHEWIREYMKDKF